MIIFYDNTTGEIDSLEHFTEIVNLPANLKGEELVRYYKEQGLNFISLPYELGSEAFNYKVIMEENGEFKALHPRGVGEY